MWLKTFGDKNIKFRLKIKIFGELKKLGLQMLDKEGTHAPIIIVTDVNFLGSSELS